MLDASRLMFAATPGKHGGNALITGLVDEVKTYNAIVSPVNPKPKADQLLRICQVGGWYCTSKPPQPPKAHKPGGGKNALRWGAIKDLLEQVGTEVATLGLRMLSGPADFKIVGSHKTGLAAADPAQRKASYWLELTDPQHRPGFVLAPLFEQWLSDNNAIATKQSFWDKIGTTANPLPADIAVKYYPELVGQAATFGLNKGMLKFEGGLLQDDDGPWDTRDSVTHFSGKGWAIFVVSPDAKIFGGSHLAGEHHHSSFLGGGMVMAAGEIACYDGFPRIITAKSGHYAPTPENMRNFVNRFRDIPADTLIQPKQAAVFYTVQDYRMNGLAATPLTKLQLETWLWKFPMAASNNAPNGTLGFKDTWAKMV